MKPAGQPLIRATDLYQLAACPHRILLDHRLDRRERAAPTPAAERLIMRGLELETRVAAGLGWPAPEYPPGDFAAGARATEALMRSGVGGIYQGVLLDGRKLAIPDLLERVEGPSRWGTYHYRPGDIKAGLEPRADHALQVGFAAALLESLQQARPREGFLILGDGRREPVVIEHLSEVLRSAEERVGRIIDGLEETFPFYGRGCGACHWRQRCLEQMVSSGDLSLVDGMTPTRRRILTRAGVGSIEELGTLDPRTWRRGGRPALGLEQLVPQARALSSGTVKTLRPLELPALEEALLVHLERDPLDGGKPGLLAWGSPAGPDRRVEVLADDDGRRQALGRLLEVLERRAGAILHLGSETPAGLELLWELGRIQPRAQVDLEARLWNLLVSLRRGAAYLPVHRYLLEQIAAALGGDRLPLPGEETPAFVLLENLRREVPGPWREQLEARGRSQLRRLRSVLDWIRRQPLRRARRRR